MVHHIVHPLDLQSSPSWIPGMHAVTRSPPSRQGCTAVLPPDETVHALHGFHTVTFLPVSVCLSAGLHQNYPTEFPETFLKQRGWGQMGTHMTSHSVCCEKGLWFIHTKLSIGSPELHFLTYGEVLHRPSKVLIAHQYSWCSLAKMQSIHPPSVLEFIRRAASAL